MWLFTGQSFVSIVIDMDNHDRRLQPIIEFAKTVKRHWNGVVRWFQTKSSNGLLEGMNSLIQVAKVRSRGFRNILNLITMIYLIGAKLEFHLPQVLPSTHTK